MEVKTYEQLIRYLEKEAANHIAYYHYTRWECLEKMMSVNSCGNGARHKFLLLTRAAKTNDGIEEKRCMRMDSETRKSSLLGGKMTPSLKIWDPRFPMIQSGPWYDERREVCPVCGFRLSDAFRSEYRNEIKMLDPAMGVRR